MVWHSSNGGPIVQYTPQVFIWVGSQIFMIEDPPYSGVDSKGEPDSTLPPRAQWHE